MEGARPTKFVFLGSSGVGKTSLIRAISRSAARTQPEPTTSLAEVEVSVRLSNGDLHRAVLWDTAGQEQYRAVTQSSYRDADVAFVVTDAGDAATDEDALFWASKVRDGGPRSLVIILLVNKVDLFVSDVSQVQQRARELKERCQCKMFLTSAVSGVGIEEAMQFAMEETTGRHETYELTKSVIIQEQEEPRVTCC